MLQYNSLQQLQLFSNCDTATSLLDTRNLLEDFQDMSAIALVFYNLKMTLLLTQNKI